MKFLFSLLTLIMLTESCSSTKKSVASDNDQQNEIMTQQTLSGTYIVEDITDTDNIKESLTINFDDTAKRVSGFSGCNSFFGNYTIDKNTIEFDNLASTKKYCQEDKNSLEQTFLEVLAKINTLSISDNSISFYKDNTLVLKVKKETKTASKPSREMVNSKQDIVGDNYTKTFITYQAASRSDFEYIQISKSSVIISEDRALKNMNTYACKAEDWEALKILLDTINVEKLHELKAPTDKRLYDGAAHATLSVIKGDAEMMTPSFDHGAPPKEIEALVNKLLSIKENISKQ